MKNITIPVNIPSDIFVSINKTEQELKDHLQVTIAVMLFNESKLTIGKATQLSGLSRQEFEKILSRNEISVSHLSLEEILADVDKLADL